MTVAPTDLAVLAAPSVRKRGVRDTVRRHPTIEISVGAQLEPGLASFREAVARITSGELDVSGLVTHRYGIERLPDGLELAREGGGIKVAIDFD